MPTTTEPANEKQSVLLPLIPIGLAILLYVLQAGQIQAESARWSFLTQLREQGATTTGTYQASKQNLRVNANGREVLVGRPRVTYQVDGAEYEAEANTDGPGIDYSVRYLPSEPRTAYCTASADVVAEIDGSIRECTWKMVFLWLAVVIPAAVGLLWLWLLLAQSNRVDGNSRAGGG